MKKNIPIGISNYRTLKERNLYHVDKTLMIKDFLDDNGTWITLITRPRRFGKTLNMSMMAEFFDITKDSKDIFSGTKIMETEYASKINQYPTIFLSFADAKGTKQNTINSIKNSLRKAYRQYRYIFTNMDEDEEEDYLDLKEAMKKGANPTLDGIETCILFLMEMLYKYYGKKVMLFIDEYDTPFIEAHVSGFYDDIRKQLASLLHNALKDADPLEYAMLTGIQRVANENIFSDLNNIEIYDLSCDGYSQYFGFTESETKQILKDFDLNFDNKVKEMYDGYHIGNIDVYNPWSILKYTKSRELGYYWINTSSNTMIKNAIEKSDIFFKKDFESLIHNGYLNTDINLGTSFYETNNTSTLWGLFVNAGYLTIAEKLGLEEYRLIIPNNEVIREFKSLVASYLNVSSKLLDNISKGLLNEDQVIFFDSLQEILLIPSYHDYKSENSYHMLFLSLCIYMQATHKAISNRESGNGRPDIILKSHTSRYPSYVIEFKYNKENENTDKLADIALEQIERKGYGIELTGRIIHIGLGVHGKKANMKWIIKQEK
ncbi:MAG: ATP-binding protein [Erysipelotrichaceae bacterium]|nr:ATP-binding protein [Erysipelotrichaceae bacterium]